MECLTQIKSSLLKRQIRFQCLLILFELVLLIFTVVNEGNQTTLNLSLTLLIVALILFTVNLLLLIIFREII
jgi:hypothetical protein